jgi:hypothetical protein
MVYKINKFFLKEHVKKIKEARQFEYEITSMRNTIKSPIITDMPVSHNVNSDSVGNIVTKMEEKEIKLLAKWDMILDEEKYIDELIDTLEDSRERTIMRYRYISGLEWEEVCVHSHYSWQWTHELHSRALKNLGFVKEQMETD